MAHSSSSGVKGHKRPNKANLWVTLRKTIQYLTLILITFLIVSIRSASLPTNLVNLPVRLDPLLTLANILTSRTILAGSLLAIITLIATLIFGRAWCGWICPLGTILDLFTVKHPTSKNKSEISLPEKLRSIKVLLLSSIFLAAVFGNLSLLIFDPLTIFYRSIASQLVARAGLGLHSRRRKACSNFLFSPPRSTRSRHGCALRFFLTTRYIIDNQ